MSQAVEVEKVKVRIRALLAKTISNGCTEAEALAAADMVGRLMSLYTLSMDEVLLREASCVQKSVAFGGIRRRPIDGCVPSLARFCDCKVWITRENGLGQYIFFGHETDVAMALYLYAVIARGMAHEARLFKEALAVKAPVLRRQRLRAYQCGIANRISDRLEDMLRLRQNDISAARSDGGALVIMKQDLVEAAFRDISIRLVAGRTRQVHSDSSFRQGYNAGDRINLNRPLREEAPSRLR
ncbi:DUF2786 domain-containing protein [Pseudoroseomonas globiformis]|uniref:DUF2786 domain-containing protein n=1 Tax=Teichococcus globiformis TaxID=2307229 RepID=A0ABV7G7N7_9PROT